MRVLESTPERLVIGREKSEDFELLCLTLWANLLVSTCGLAIFPVLGNYTYALCFAVSSLLILLAFPRDRGIVSYLFMVILASMSFMGAIFLSYLIMSLLQFPHISSLTFDKNRNLLTIKKSKFLFWYPTTQYPMDQVIGARLDTKSIFVPSSNIVTTSVLLLALRGRNGRETKKKILVGVEANSNLVHQINDFLLMP